MGLHLGPKAMQWVGHGAVGGGGGGGGGGTCGGVWGTGPPTPTLGTGRYVKTTHHNTSSCGNSIMAIYGVTHND